MRPGAPASQVKTDGLTFYRYTQEHGPLEP